MERPVRNTLARVIATTLWLISMTAIFAIMIHYTHHN